MKIVLFYQSLISDWNNGNAHFLRGIVSELMERGYTVEVYEPHDSWSYNNLLKEEGTQPVEDFYKAYPNLKSVRYSLFQLDMDEAIGDAALVIVHEWNDPALIKMIGDYKKVNSNFTLLFHDTHHRSVTAPQEMQLFDLSRYDGVLAYGRIIKDIYLQNNWHDKIFVWHEAADTNIFKPLKSADNDGDLVWIGNWGDEERTEELYDYFIAPSLEMNLRSTMYGVRYPEEALEKLIATGIGYKGWVPNYLVPEVFAAYKATVHIPRRPYAELLPGIPTIRPFEAMACGIPLISAPWEDTDNLFREGEDYLLAADEKEMRAYIKMVLHDPDLANSLSHKGRETILERHTCSHRADELIEIYKSIVNVEETL